VHPLLLKFCICKVTHICRCRFIQEFSQAARRRSHLRKKGHPPAKQICAQAIADFTLEHGGGGGGARGHGRFWHSHGPVVMIERLSAFLFSFKRTKFLFITTFVLGRAGPTCGQLQYTNKRLHGSAAEPQFPQHKSLKKTSKKAAAARELLMGACSLPTAVLYLALNFQSIQCQCSSSSGISSF